MKITIDELAQLLIERWDYKIHNAKRTAEKLMKMDDNILSYFNDYLETDHYPCDFRLFGLSLEDIAEAYPLKPPAVFLFFDWVVRVPVEALDALVDEYHKPLPKSFKSDELKQYLDHKQSELNEE